MINEKRGKKENKSRKKMINEKIRKKMINEKNEIKTKIRQGIVKKRN